MRLAVGHLEAAERRRAGRPCSFEQHEQRRDHRGLHDPARQHARRRDEAEVAKRAKVRGEERAVGRCCGERGDDGRLPGRPHRASNGVVGRDALRALLEVPRLVEDADVDAVARHDAHEKRRRDVEMADHHLREPERPDEPDDDGDAHDDDGAHAQEVEDDHREDEPDPDGAHIEKVGEDDVVLGKPRGHPPANETRTPANLRRRPHVVDDGVDDRAHLSCAACRRQRSESGQRRRERSRRRSRSIRWESDRRAGDRFHDRYPRGATWAWVAAGAVCRRRGRSRRPSAPRNPTARRPAPRRARDRRGRGRARFAAR